MVRGLFLQADGSLSSLRHRGADLLYFRSEIGGHVIYLPFRDTCFFLWTRKYNFYFGCSTNATNARRMSPAHPVFRLISLKIARLREVIQPRINDVSKIHMPYPPLLESV